MENDIFGPVITRLERSKLEESKIEDCQNTPICSNYILLKLEKSECAVWTLYQYIVSCRAYLKTPQHYSPHPWFVFYCHYLSYLHTNLKAIPSMLMTIMCAKKKPATSKLQSSKQWMHVIVTCEVLFAFDAGKYKALDEQ